MKKIIVTGCNGQLGREINRLYAANGELEFINTDVDELDITSIDSVMKLAREVNPYAIINCAAYTAVDACETNRDLAFRVNVLGPRNLAIAATETGAKLVHVSTDYVFDGKKETPYYETDAVCPHSVYGATKAEAEKMVERFANRYFILRTAWLYGLGGKNFVKTMLRLSETHDTLNVVADQHGSPTSTTTLCRIIEGVMEKEPEYGIYHSTNEGFTTWYGFTKKIMELAGKSTVVNPLTSEEYKQMNPASSDRPKNSQLSKDKLKSIGIVPANWEDALAEYLKEELK